MIKRRGNLYEKTAVHTMIGDDSLEDQANRVIPCVVAAVNE